MFCKNCGAELTEGAAFCAVCGTPCTNALDNQATNTAAPETPPVAPEIPPVIPQVIPAAPIVAPKKKTKYWILGGIAAAVLLLAVLVGVNFEFLQNFFMKNFTSNEKYYEFVLSKEVKERSKNIGGLYENYLEYFKLYDHSYDGEAVLDLTKDGEELLGLFGIAGYDLSWLRNAGIQFSFNSKDNRMDYQTGVSFGKEKLLTLKGVLDLDESLAYLSIPELSEDYICTSSQDEYSSYDTLYDLKYLEGVIKSCPDRKTVEKLMERYSIITYQSVRDVEKSAEKLQAGDITQNCTKLTVTLDDKAQQRMYENILKELKRDKEVKKIILHADDEVSYLSGEELYQEFISEIEDALADAERYAFAAPDMTITLYVDNKGIVRGKEIQQLNTGESSVLWMPRKGRKLGYEFSYSEGGESYALTGNGKYTGKKLDGDFALEYNGAKLLKLQITKLDTKTLYQGLINGEIAVSPGKQLEYLMDTDSGAYLKGYQMDLLFHMTREKAGVDITLLQDESSLGTLKINVKNASGQKVKLPDKKHIVDGTDDDVIVSWLSEQDWDKFLRELKDKGFPKEYLTSVEALLEELQYYTTMGY